MGTVASRDLRNHTAEVLRRVSEGEEITITVNGEEVAELRPVARTRAASMPRAELVDLLLYHQADAGLRRDLAELAGDTTDDLGPIR